VFQVQNIQLSGVEQWILHKHAPFASRAHSRSYLLIPTVLLPLVVTMACASLFNSVLIAKVYFFLISHCMILNRYSALIRLLKSDFPQLYCLYEHLNDRGTLPTADELAMAKDEAAFDMTAVDAHLARLEGESNTSQQAGA
jgi:hypothetical protein